MNGILDPGFELGSAAWQYMPPAGSLQLVLAERQDVTVNTGKWAVKLQRRNTEDAGDPEVYIGGYVRQGGIPVGFGQSQGFGAPLGTSVPVAVSVNGDSRGLTRLQCWVDRGNGSLTLLGTITTPPAGWSRWSVGSLVSLGGFMGIQFHVFHPGSGVGTWYVDDVLAQVPDSDVLMREQIRAALLAKLQGISVANGYLTNVAAVSEGKIRMDALPALPALFLRPAGAQADDSAAFHNIRCNAFWAITAYVHDEDDAPDLIESLMRDVAKATETDQSLGGLGFIQDDRGRAVMLTDEDPFDAGQEVTRGLQSYAMLVRTIYLAPQGQR